MHDAITNAAIEELRNHGLSATTVNTLISGLPSNWQLKTKPNLRFYQQLYQSLLPAKLSDRQLGHIFR